jgi:hypothetical protein
LVRCRATPASFSATSNLGRNFKCQKADEMTDQDKSDDINRSMEHLAKYCPEVCGSMPSAKGTAAMTVEIINATLSLSLATDEYTKLAFERIKARGRTGAKAIDLMGKAISAVCKKICCRCRTVAGRHGGAGRGAHPG